MKPWCQLPIWTRSNECHNLCRLLVSLQQQHPAQHSLPVTVAQHVADYLGPLPLLAVRSASGLRLFEENGTVRASITRGMFYPIPKDPMVLSHPIPAFAYSPAGDRVAVGIADTVHLLDVYIGHWRVTQSGLNILAQWQNNSRPLRLHGRNLDHNWV